MWETLDSIERRGAGKVDTAIFADPELAHARHGGQPVQIAQGRRPVLAAVKPGRLHGWQGMHCGEGQKVSSEVQLAQRGQRGECGEIGPRRIEVQFHLGELGHPGDGRKIDERVTDRRDVFGEVESAQRAEADNGGKVGDFAAVDGDFLDVRKEAQRAEVADWALRPARVRHHFNVRPHLHGAFEVCAGDARAVGGVFVPLAPEPVDGVPIKLKRVLVLVPVKPPAVLDEQFGGVKFVAGAGGVYGPLVKVVGKAHGKNWCGDGSTINA